MYKRFQNTFISSRLIKCSYVFLFVLGLGWIKSKTHFYKRLLFLAISQSFLKFVHCYHKLLVDMWGVFGLLDNSLGATFLSVLGPQKVWCFFTTHFSKLQGCSDNFWWTHFCIFVKDFLLPLHCIFKTTTFCVQIIRYFCFFYPIPAFLTICLWISQQE